MDSERKHSERVESLRRDYIMRFSLPELEASLARTDKSCEEELEVIRMAISNYQKVISVLGYEP
ncbi:MAG: hypothetical protein ACHQ6U_06865 [Thermodesulfobacteriota bacterium]